MEPKVPGFCVGVKLTSPRALRGERRPPSAAVLKNAEAKPRLWLSAAKASGEGQSTLEPHLKSVRLGSERSSSRDQRYSDCWFARPLTRRALARKCAAGRGDLSPQRAGRG